MGVEVEEVCECSASFCGDGHGSVLRGSGQPTSLQQLSAQGGAQDAAEVIAAFGPVQAGAQEWAAGLAQDVRSGQVDEPGAACGCEDQAVSDSDERSVHERVEQGDSEGAGEVVVAGAGDDEAPGGPNSAQRGRLVWYCDDGGKVLHELRGLVVGQG